MYIFNRITTGYAKKQRGKACEDAVLTKEYKDYSIMVCADGHGDRKCKYAAKGAMLATWVSNKVLKEMRNPEDTLEEYGKLLNDNRKEIMKKIVCEWVCAVLDDYKINNPQDTYFQEKFKKLYAYVKHIYEVRNESIPAREYQKLVEYRQNCEQDIYKITLMYGTTVNAVVISKKFVFAIGLGDGDIVVVNKNRVEWLLPMIPQFYSMPASLCGNFSTIIEKYFAVYVPITSARKVTDTYFVPEILMITTDGLRNSFLSDEAFAEKLIDIANCFKKGNGRTFVKNSKQWIEERSEMGATQDDICFAFYSKYDVKSTKKQKVKNND